MENNAIGAAAEAAAAAAAEEGGLAGRIGSSIASDPDKIVPITPGQPDSPDSGTTPLVVKPPGDSPVSSNPSFIGNAGWVAPGIMTSMANTIWQESKAATDPSEKIILNSEAVTGYMTNQSGVLTTYSNALLTQIDNTSIHNLLSVLAGGSFIETNWSQAVFEAGCNADVVSRQINNAWQSPSVGGTYVSYTQLHDNVNGTICNGTHVGPRSTQVCADTGVYFLNVLNLVDLSPSLLATGPPGFDQLGTYGIYPWWPVSASATAYRIMNPDGNVVPPVITATDDSGFATFMSNFASSNPYGLLAAIGQLPGSWTFPVW